MIIDSLENASCYYGLGERFERALRYLAETDLKSLAPERHDIDGDDVYVMVQEYATKSWEEGVWESHREYADIQYVVTGAEFIGFAPVESLDQKAEYDEEKDFVKLDGKGTFFAVTPGTFMLFLPQDGHMPGMTIGPSGGKVRKAVVKVRL
jgi:YhcH/YjgK/YiaL family protein